MIIINNYRNQSKPTLLNTNTLGYLSTLPSSYCMYIAQFNTDCLFLCDNNNNKTTELFYDRGHHFVFTSLLVELVSTIGWFLPSFLPSVLPAMHASLLLHTSVYLYIYINRPQQENYMNRKYIPLNSTTWINLTNLILEQMLD